MKAFHAIPFFVFLVLCIAMAGLMFKPAPPGVIEAPLPPFDYAFPENEPVLVNFFASWCTPCRAEHSILSDLAAAHKIKIYGVAYKDKPQDVEKYLTELGNPYDKIILDEAGMIFIDWGLTGVPESFLVYDGKIRLQHLGPIMPDDVERKFLPAIRSFTQ